MPGKWTDVKVFISSTFRDMHAERDWLVKRVFPKLRAKLEPYRIHLIDIDLRWGVTAEQADNDRALDLCLEQIDECRPLFLGILGERYGWVPHKLPQFDTLEYGWVQAMTGKSITELEIIHGVLNDHEMQPRSFFYFRDDRFLSTLSGQDRLLFEETPTDEEQQQLSPQEAEARAQHRRDQLDVLKTTILAGRPVVNVVENYPCHFEGRKINWRIARRQLDAADLQLMEQVAADGIVDPDEYATLPGHLQTFVDQHAVPYLGGLEAFGTSVSERLEQAILHPDPDSELAQHLREMREPQADPLGLIAESDQHERFMESRLRIYVGRDKLRQALTRFANADHPVPALVTGPSGSGKSAAMAHFVTGYRDAHPGVFVIPHFIGASAASTSLRQMLRRFCLLLQQEFGFEEEVPQETNRLTSTFRDFLGRIPDDRRVLLVCDALNQLDETDNAQSLAWFPWQLPPHVKLVASCIDDPGRTEAVLEAFRHHKHGLLAVKPLTDQERFEIVETVPSLSAKTLDPAQVGLLLDNPATTNPLFLLVALEELRGFGSFEELNDRIRLFPRGGDDTVTALFLQVIERLETDFGPVLTQHVLTALASARRGLSERELEQLLAARSPAEDQRHPAEPEPVEPDSGEPDSGDLPTDNLYPLLRQLRAYLLHRADLLDFYHRNLAKAVRTKYLRADESRHAAHRELADFFEAQPLWQGRGEGRAANTRAVDELPWQRIAAEDWEGLERTLTDLEFVEAKTAAGLTYELVHDYTDGLGALPELHAERQQERQREAQLRHYGADLMAYAKAKGRGLPLPAPPDTRPSLESIRRAEAASADPDQAVTEPDTRAARVRRFANFVSAHSHQLDRFADQALPIAFNHAAAGPVAEQAAALLGSLRNCWLRRDPRPPALPPSPLCLRTLTGHTNRVTSVALTPDGRRAVSASGDETLRVWDVESGESLRTLSGHTDRVTSVALTPDGRRAVSASLDQTLRVWDVETGRTVAVYPLESEGYSLAISAGGRIVAGTQIGQLHFLTLRNCPPLPEGSTEPATTPPRS